jgi:hypothetical protein
MLRPLEHTCQTTGGENSCRGRTIPDLRIRTGEEDRDAVTPVTSAET